MSDQLTDQRFPGPELTRIMFSLVIPGLEHRNALKGTEPHS